MAADADIHAALMAQAETITGYSILWPQVGGDVPEGEHITVQVLPNDNEPVGTADDVYFRQGFLIITLVSPLGVHEVVTKRKAGELAAYFKRGCRLESNGTKVTIRGHTVKPGRQVETRWETPIWIEYWSKA